MLKLVYNPLMRYDKNPKEKKKVQKEEVAIVPEENEPAETEEKPEPMTKDKFLDAMKDMDELLKGMQDDGEAENDSEEQEQEK